MNKNKWSHGCYRKVVLTMQKDSSQVSTGSFEISFLCSLILLKLNITWMKIWKTFLSHSKHFLSSRQAAKLLLIHRIKPNLSLSKRQKYSLLTIISDNSNKNEKTKCLKILVGSVRWGNLMGENFPGGSFPRGNLMGGNFPGGILQGRFDGWEFSGWEFSRRNFPDTASKEESEENPPSSINTQLVH